MRSPHARLEPSVPVPVAAVAGRLAHLLGLRGHHAVGDVLGDSVDQLLEVDAAVLEPRHRHLRGDALCYAFHCGPRPFVEPDFVVISDSRTGSLLFHLVALMALPRLHQHSRRDLLAGCGSSTAAPRARWPRAGAGITIPAGRRRAPTRSRGPAHVLFWAAGRPRPTQDSSQRAPDGESECDAAPRDQQRNPHAAWVNSRGSLACQAGVD